MQLSDYARTAINLSEDIARQYGCRSVDCQHLLLALVSMECPANKILQEGLGILPDRIKKEVTTRFGTPSGEQITGGLDTTADYSEVMSAAGILVQERGETITGTEHLLLALSMAEEAGKVRQLLRELGATSSNLESLIPKA